MNALYRGSQRKATPSVNKPSGAGRRRQKTPCAVAPQRQTAVEVAEDHERRCLGPAAVRPGLETQHLSAKDRAGLRSVPIPVLRCTPAPGLQVDRQEPQLPAVFRHRDVRSPTQERMSHAQGLRIVVAAIGDPLPDGKPRRQVTEMRLRPIPAPAGPLHRRPRRHLHMPVRCGEDAACRRRVLHLLEGDDIGVQFRDPPRKRVVVGAVARDAPRAVAVVEMFQIPRGDAQLAGKARRPRHGQCQEYQGQQRSDGAHQGLPGPRRLQRSSPALPGPPRRLADRRVEGLPGEGQALGSKREPSDPRRHRQREGHRMSSLIYAGIGSRATPRTVLEQMSVMAAWLARRSWHLHTGGAVGADTAFAAGAPPGRRTLFLPWPGYSGGGGPDFCTLSADKMDRCLATRVGPASRLAPLLSRRPQASRTQRSGPARCGSHLARQRGGLLDRRRGCQRRHRHEHSHRPPARDSGAEPGRPPPARRL